MAEISRWRAKEFELPARSMKTQNGAAEHLACDGLRTFLASLIVAADRKAYPGALHTPRAAISILRSTRAVQQAQINAKSMDSALPEPKVQQITDYELQRAERIARNKRALQVRWAAALPQGASPQALPLYATGYFNPLTAL